MSNEMKKYALKLINRQVMGEYYTFDFNFPEGIEFTEGQYGIFTHVDKQIDGRKVRALSIASSKDEPFFRVATKIIAEPSDFKVKMKELNIGDTMTFDGPMGKFILEFDHNSVFIAGGIGITPVRSIFKQIENNNYDKSVELIYSESEEIYPFKDELDEMNFCRKHYESNTEGTKNRIKEITLKYMNDAYYYVVGSPGFLSGVKEQIIDLGIKPENIKFDRFNGY